MNKSVNQPVNKSVTSTSRTSSNEQGTNLNDIGKAMRNMTSEQCYMKKLDILDSLLPKAKNIPHKETRRIQIIGILEMIVKYIHYIHGRDTTDILDELNQKINKLKAEQEEVEKERERIYQKWVGEIFEKLTKNLSNIE